jgi:hypothetical protein
VKLVQGDDLGDGQVENPAQLTAVLVDGAHNAPEGTEDVLVVLPVIHSV